MSLKDLSSFAAKSAYYSLTFIIGPAGIGIFLVVCACFLYYAFAFTWVIFATWLAGIILAGLAFFRAKPIDCHLDRKDVFCALALLAMALPIFLWSIYNVPVQLNNDEAIHMLFEQRWTKEGRIDLFGISPYFGFPYCPLLLLGWAGQFLGGINLYNQRLLHGLDAVLIVIAAYCFFRVLGLKRVMALTAAAIICTHHVLILYSRRAMRDNPAVLVEILTLLFLFAGLRLRSSLMSYCGGIFAGLCFYQYYPARISLPISLLFLSLLFCSHNHTFTKKEILKVSMSFLFGLILTASPMYIAHLRDPETSREAIFYQRSICIWFREGRRTTRLFNDAKDETEGVLRNIVYGLTTFNNLLNDRGHSAKNEASNNCFLDPLSGLLFWLGFIYLIRFSRGQPAVVLMVSGVVLQIIFYSFIVGQAPDFFRLLVTLPFVGYFVAHGIASAASFVESRLKGWPKSAIAGRLCFIGLFVAVVFSNGFIVFAYVEDGFRLGDEAGGTLRYIGARNGQREHCFIFADGPDRHYFSWAKKSDWCSWVEPFLGPGQEARFFTPDDLTTYRLTPPFTIFVNGDVWREKQRELETMYPHLEVHKIAEERGLLALEDKTRSFRSTYEVNYLPLVEGALQAGEDHNVITLTTKALASMPSSNFGSDYKAAILLARGTAYIHEGKCKLAVQNLVEALNIEEKAIGTRDSALSKYAYTLGDAYMCLGDFALALKYYREGLQMALNAKDDEYFDMEPAEIAQGKEMIAKVQSRQKQPLKQSSGPR